MLHCNGGALSVSTCTITCNTAAAVFLANKSNSCYNKTDDLKCVSEGVYVLWQWQENEDNLLTVFQQWLMRTVFQSMSTVSLKCIGASKNSEHLAENYEVPVDIIVQEPENPFESCYRLQSMH